MDKQAGHQLEQADKWFGARGPGQLAPGDNLVHSSRHRKPHSRWGSATEGSAAGRGCPRRRGSPSHLPLALKGPRQLLQQRHDFISLNTDSSGVNFQWKHLPQLLIMLFVKTRPGVPGTCFREELAVWEQSHRVSAAEFCSPPDLWSLIGV